MILILVGHDLPQVKKKYIYQMTRFDDPKLQNAT